MNFDMESDSTAPPAFTASDDSSSQPPVRSTTDDGKPKEKTSARPRIATIHNMDRSSDDDEQGQVFNECSPLRFRTSFNSPTKFRHFTLEDLNDQVNKCSVHHQRKIQCETMYRMCSVQPESMELKLLINTRLQPHPDRQSILLVRIILLMDFQL